MVVRESQQWQEKKRVRNGLVLKPDYLLSAEASQYISMAIPLNYRHSRHCRTSHNRTSRNRGASILVISDVQWQVDGDHDGGAGRNCDLCGHVGRRSQVGRYAIHDSILPLYALPI